MQTDELKISVSDWSTYGFALAAGALLCLLLLQNVKKARFAKRAKLPPGPAGFPLLGHMPYGSNCINYVKCSEWTKEYGPIFRINMGITNVVILNTLEAIKEFMSKKEILSRPETLTFSRSGVRGVGTINGKPWADNRRFCLHEMRNLGFGKGSMEEYIKDEAQVLADKIGEFQGTPLYIQKFLVPSTSNNITMLVFGTRYSYDDPRRQALDQLLDKMRKLAFTGSFIAAMPAWVYNIAARISFTKTYASTKLAGEISNFIREQIEEHERTLEQRSHHDFIDGYLKIMKERENDPGSLFQREYRQEP